MAARWEFSSADERWEVLCFAALAVERKPTSATGGDVLMRDARRCEADRGMPFTALRGMALRWRSMDERGRASNGKALGDLARRCQAILKGLPDPGAPTMRPRADVDG